MKMQNFQAKRIEKSESTVSEQQHEPKKKKSNKCPLRHSNFFITINTQKNMNSLSVEESAHLKEKFNSVMDRFYNEKLKDFIIMKPSKSCDTYGLEPNPSQEQLAARVEKASAEYVIEIGSESGRLHSHGIICLSKRGCDTKLDYEKIRSWLQESLGFECHFYNTMFRDAKGNLLEYIKKAPIV